MKSICKAACWTVAFLFCGTVIAALLSSQYGMVFLRELRFSEGVVATGSCSPRADAPAVYHEIRFDNLVTNGAGRCRLEILEKQWDIAAFDFDDCKTLGGRVVARPDGEGSMQAGFVQWGPQGRDGSLELIRTDESRRLTLRWYRTSPSVFAIVSNKGERLRLPTDAAHLSAIFGQPVSVKEEPVK